MDAPDEGAGPAEGHGGERAEVLLVFIDHVDDVSGWFMYHTSQVLGLGAPPTHLPELDGHENRHPPA